MIQPVSALTPRATFRGSDVTRTTRALGNKSKGLTESGIAIINAGGVAAAAGGITAAISRNYTHTWSHAGVLGVCAAFLAMFFMTPHLIDKVSFKAFSNKQHDIELLAKEDAPKVIEVVKEHLKPAKKLVQFRSDATPTTPTQIPNS